jgi:hypothetical protein
MHNFYSGKSSPNFWAIYAIFFIKLPKVNNRQIGENSPNLVALRTYVSQHSLPIQVTKMAALQLPRSLCGIRNPES